SYLINLSRGDVVDLVALEQCLQTKHLAGAALDVYPEEPQESSAPFSLSLQNHPNVILTPHIGGSTQEAQENIGHFVLNRLHEYLELGATIGCLNLPQLQLPEIQGSHRIIHIHRNVPGILAQINSILAKHDVNVVGQYLKTEEELGYVITDTNVLNGESFLKELEHIEHTLRLRILY
ncbi:MAG TPA: NAD(P)-dependent oxidoreductase, partial [Gammaproteobacteria bacterium]|nr:NAD(P)-dependent oxidoreductase [Gammaproteobacteria bacterium]